MLGFSKGNTAVLHHADMHLCKQGRKYDASTNTEDSALFHSSERARIYRGNPYGKVQVSLLAVHAV